MAAPSTTTTTTTSSASPLTLAEIELRAKDRLPSHIYEFYASGSDNEEALRRNVEAFGRLCIRPRVLVDVSRVDTSTELFGWKTSLPIGIAPSAMQKLAGGNGELDIVRAAAGLCINMTLSSQSTTSLEDVSRAQKSVIGDTQVKAPPLWMQLYLYEDMQRSIQLIRRAEESSYEALVLTVDTPVLGNRLAERRTAVVLPPGMSLPNTNAASSSSSQSNSRNLLPSVNRLLMNARTAADARALQQSSGAVMHSSSMTWATSLSFLRRMTKMRIILKGIMTGEDALLAVQHGADAIIVSNHGGRQLSSTCATIEALPEIVNAVKGRIPIILDGGVRTGADVFKALALGANFVCIGRPALWGLAYDGQKGVEAVINILERELSRTMALAGVATIKDISRDRLGIVARDGFGIAKL